MHTTMAYLVDARKNYIAVVWYGTPRGYPVHCVPGSSSVKELRFLRDHPVTKVLLLP